MPRRTRSPQEKKRRSLERDRPVGAAEYPKAFRKNWPRKKARAERARRTADRTALAVDPAGFVPARRERVRKWGAGVPQPTLGEIIAGKQERRAKLRATPRKSAAARERRRVRRAKKS